LPIQLPVKKRIVEKEGNWKNSVGNLFCCLS